MNLHIDNTSWIIWAEGKSLILSRRSDVPLGGFGFVLLRPVGSTIRTHSPDGPDSQLDPVHLVDPETSGNDKPMVDC